MGMPRYRNRVVMPRNCDRVTVVRDIHRVAMLPVGMSAGSHEAHGAGDALVLEIDPGNKIRPLRDSVVMVGGVRITAVILHMLG